VSADAGPANPSGVGGDVVGFIPNNGGYTQVGVINGSIEPHYFTYLNNAPDIAVDHNGTVYLWDGFDTGVDIDQFIPNSVGTISPKIAWYSGKSISGSDAGGLDAGGLAVDGSGNIYLAHLKSGNVYLWSPNAVGAGSSVSPIRNVTQIAAGLASPAGLAVDASDNVYEADGSGSILEF
jgi:hypothetical protein